MMIQTSRIISKYLLQFCLTIFGIGLITATSFTLFLPKGERLVEFWNQLQIFFWSFFYFNNLEVYLKEFQYVPFSSVFLEPYVYSFTILFSAFLLSIFVALFFAYIVNIGPKSFRKVMNSTLFFLQSIPDVVMICAFQILFLWIFNKTGVKIVDPISGFESKAYALPIILVSIIPTIQLFQMLFLAIQEEKIRDYVEYAKAKGLSNSWIIIRHILRNVTITLLSNSKLIFWMMISNLLIVEKFFNMKGYFSFLFNNSSSPEIFFMALVLLFIPFFFLEILFKQIVNRMKGGQAI
ncbi:ABC transporter permease subunit [Gottfriedia acidiceleris]|uniref:ABC transporter permease subunit n=1 Tax=Gottfriedia acidiceleris TaxID=371036 RepID=A0ABY4JHQ6_9BACI|nr:ABC transporter permease subunit [Gottfriedia acidiceleris]UPM52570.1 ABC transporter permease subunit [Gottfriedia acidiceleris]